MNDFIKAGGELINVTQIARAVWRGRELYLNTAGGFVRLEGRQASMVWAMLEDRLAFDAETGELKQAK